MKFFKILTLFLTMSIMEFAFAMDNSDKTALAKPQDATSTTSKTKIIKGSSPLDVVTDINDIQNIIRAYADEWYIAIKLNSPSQMVSGLVLLLNNGYKIEPNDTAIYCSEIKDIKKDLYWAKLTQHPAIEGRGDYNIEIVDLKTNKVLYKLPDKTTTIFVFMTPDNKKVLYAHGRHIKIWDLDLNKSSKNIITSESIIALTMTSDGKKIISSNGHRIDIWDIDTGNLLKELRDNSSAHSLTINNNGKWLFAAGYRSGVPINLDSYKMGSFSFSPKTPNTIVLISNGTICISSFNDDETIAIYDISKPKEILQTWKFNKAGEIAITQDGKQIVAAADGQLIVFQNYAHDLEKQESQNCVENNTDDKSDKDMHKCANAGCDNQATQRCAKCKLVYYCSKNCQEEHWAIHKSLCK